MKQANIAISFVSLNMAKEQFTFFPIDNENEKLTEWRETL